MSDKNRKYSRRRGSTYVAVLGVAMAVTAIGLGSVAVSRIQTRSTTQANQWAEARMLAFSANEHAMSQINNTSSWRANLNGVTVQRSLGPGNFTWQVIDPSDGDLADNSSDPATLIATGTVGDAVYSLTVRLSTPGQVQGSVGENTTIWGVNEDDGMLFSIADYTQDPMSVTKYGLLYWNDAGTHRLVSNRIKSFTIDAAGVAYMVCEHAIGPHPDPVLIRFSLQTASTTQDNVVEIVGSINRPAPNDHIHAMAIDPTDSKLYVLGREGTSTAADKLLVINKLTAEITEDLGPITGQGSEMVGQGLGMAFDGSGALYITDRRNNCVYKVDKSTATITQVVDNNAAPTSTFQALAWDSVNSRLIAVHETTKKIYHITLQNGNNTAYGSLGPSGVNDAQGISFVPAGAATSTVRTMQVSNAIERKID